MSGILYYTNYLAESDAVSFIKEGVTSYLSTMREVAVDSFQDLMPAITSLAAKFDRILLSQNFAVLTTASVGLFGFVIVFMILWTLLKCVRYIFIGSSAQDEIKWSTDAVKRVQTMRKAGSQRTQDYQNNDINYYSSEEEDDNAKQSFRNEVKRFTHHRQEFQQDDGDISEDEDENIRVDPARGIDDSKRWFKQAWNDLLSARNDFECDNPAPEWVCFKSVQAVEKALKALILIRRHELVQTHDISELAAITGDINLCNSARKLQNRVGRSPRTRYPDVLPSPMTPRDFYSLNDALEVHELADSIVQQIRLKLGRAFGAENGSTSGR